MRSIVGGAAMLTLALVWALVTWLWSPETAGSSRLPVVMVSISGALFLIHGLVSRKRK